MTQDGRSNAFHQSYLSPEIGPFDLLPHWQNVFHCQSWYFVALRIVGLFQWAEHLLLLLHPIWTWGKLPPILTTYQQKTNIAFLLTGAYSMKSIINGDMALLVLGEICIHLATLWVVQIMQFLQKNSANVVNPFVNHKSFNCATIPPFDAWSNPCVNLA